MASKSPLGLRCMEHGRSRSGTLHFRLNLLATTCGKSSRVVAEDRGEVVPRTTQLARVVLLLAVSWGSACSFSPEFTAKVVGVSDGDTITVLRDRSQVRIRLDGIDCPE